MVEIIILWLSVIGLLGGAVLFVRAAARLRSLDAPPSNVIVLPPRPARSGPTHVVRHEMPASLFFDQDALA